MAESPNPKKEFKHKCELRLLVCEPNPFRPDRVTVGFVLSDKSGDQPRVEVRLAANLTAIRCIHPNADLEAIEGTLLEMEPILRNVTDFEQYLQNLPFEAPAEFSFLPGTAVLTNSIEEELKLLTNQYLVHPKRVLPDSDEEDIGKGDTRENQVGRPYILRKMKEAFRHFELFPFLHTDIPVAKYTFKSDPLNLDFRYHNPETDLYRMMHAASVVVDTDRTTLLAYKWAEIQDRMATDLGGPCELYGIVEDVKFQQSETAQQQLLLLADKGIIVKPVSSMMQIAAQVKADLRA